MAWTIDYSSDARRTLRKLDRQNAKRIVDFLDYRVAESDSPRSLGESLSGPLSGYWKYRVGDFRLICDIQDGKLVVLVVEIGHRREIYR